MKASLAYYSEISQKYSAAFEALGEIAESYHAFGRSSDARHLLQTSLQLAAADEARPQRLKLLLKQGKILAIEYVYTNSDSEMMFSTLLESRQLAEEANDRQGLADALSLLGMAHYFVDLNSSPSINSSSGQYNEALANQQQALELREALGDTRGISESTFLIGTVYERRQQLQAALEHYEKAYRIAEQFNHTYEKTEPSRHLAYHALSQGTLEEALQYALQALTLREEAGFRPYQPLDHLLVSDIYLKQGDIERALKHATQASVLAQEMGYKRAIASSLLTIGDILALQHEQDQAIAHYKQALLLAKELQLPLGISRAKERLERIVKL
ncbi:tetratricopeptide repeat protein [Paenibacillus sepulcri]|uniref:Tetratricopeptide repeat protein n=1 Tax=Paenibacillus sepulcri TaxID=359917 RepID=A0ABS7C932_9BACL|nr:tetratricopeptide repeat protein [Paenibacillus sepulcri]